MLCDWLEVEVSDVVQQSSSAAPLVTELDPLQEEELLRDMPLLLIAFLTLNRWSEAEILDVFNFRKPDLAQTVAAAGTARPDRADALGPHQDPRRAQFHLAQGRTHPEVLCGARAAGVPRHAFRCAGGTDEFRRRHAVALLGAQGPGAHGDAGARARRLVKQDLHLPVRERYGVSLFMGLRPWEFSEFTRMRRKPREKFF